MINILEGVRESVFQPAETAPEKALTGELVCCVELK